MVKKVTICFEPDGRKVPVQLDRNLFEIARQAGVEIRSECGGKQSCGKCRVIIEDQKEVSKISEFETKYLTQDEIAKGYRLACCCTIKKGDFVVFIPSESRIGKSKIQVEGMDRFVKLDPVIAKVHLQMAKPTLCDIKSDFERLVDSLSFEGFSNLEIEPSLLENLPEILRDTKWDVTVTLWNNRRIIAIEKGNTTSVKYGFSVDIGTSTLVGYLVDLNSGNVVNIQSQENPQVIYGEDILSRIDFTSTTERGLEKLQDITIGAINDLISNACQDHRINQDSIYEITVVGNTAMHHLFLGIQPKFLSIAPFIPAIKRSINTKANYLKVRVNPLANIHVFPIVAGFVGADAVADIIATGIHQTQKICLLIDVGTNGEVFVGNKKDILSCSCAAGPAFEGMHIRYGMKARTGAIEQVKINQDAFEVKYETIGGVKPVGICGSGMVDAVAEMLKCGITTQRGGINKDLEVQRIVKVNGERQFVIAWKHETGIGRDITINGKDIQEIQLAKAAIQTGTTILMNEKAMTANELDQVYIAGAFGKYINPESARFIGLIPDVPTKKIKFVGNTAVTGAKMALISGNIRKQAERLSNEIRYIELMTAQNFQKEFRNSMFLPYWDLTRYPTVMKNIHR
jgi:uncharacterized 2Fe-2S/4Fe-4S cluster protein (DUF4445 family)